MWTKSAFIFFMLSIYYTHLQRKLVSEVQQTEIEKLADSFKLAGFTLADTFENSLNPQQIVLIFSAFYSPLDFRNSFLVGAPTQIFFGLKMLF